MSEKNTAPLLDQSSKTRVSKVNHQTAAAKYNKAMYHWLGGMLKKDPEADLRTLLSPNYSKKLESFKVQKFTPKTLESGVSITQNDLRSGLSISDPCTILYKLSEKLTSLTQNNLPESLIELFAQSEVIFGGNSTTCMVLRAHQTFAIKITHSELLTEHSSLLFLQENLPEFPAPKPHGLVQFGKVYVLFMSFIPGVSMESIWHELDSGQKEGIRSQLDDLFCSLRLLPHPANSPLGGVQGEGCKDIRRGVRTCSDPILTEEQFREFIFTGSTTASPLYTALLHNLMPTPSGKVVFTHGDLRPANMIMNIDDDNGWKISGILDWEASGFYPAYWESVKMTNNLTPRDTLDWYKYLPASVSFQQYTVQWLVDRLWDPLMENS